MLKDRIRDAIGEKAAQQLIEKYGGTKLWIPVKPYPHHSRVATAGIDSYNRIARIIGPDGAAALCKAFGGEYLPVPISIRNLRHQIVDLAADGMLSREIARRLGCTHRWVNHVLSEQDEAR